MCGDYWCPWLLSLDVLCSPYSGVVGLFLQLKKISRSSGPGLIFLTMSRRNEVRKRQFLFEGPPQLLSVRVEPAEPEDTSVPGRHS